MRRSNIIFADSNEALREVAARQLMAGGHDVHEVTDAAGALARLRSDSSDLMVVDFNLPDILGLDLLREIKSNSDFSAVRVLMTSDRGRNDAVSALKSGADDYLAKPYSLNELLARVATALRRPAVRRESFGQQSAGAICIDDVRHMVEINEQPVELSPLEYKLLQFFVKNSDQMFSRQKLLMHVWKNVDGVNDRTVDVNIRRLRSRLAPFKCEDYIQTVRGSGYRFSVRNRRAGRIVMHSSQLT